MSMRGGNGAEEDEKPKVVTPGFTRKAIVVEDDAFKAELDNSRKHIDRVIQKQNQDKKPREFWVKQAKRDADRLCCDYEPEPHDGEVFIHVREVLPDAPTELELKMRDALKRLKHQEFWVEENEDGETVGMNSASKRALKALAAFDAKYGGQK